MSSLCGDIYLQMRGRCQPKHAHKERHPLLHDLSGRAGPPHTRVLSRPPVPTGGPAPSLIKFFPAAARCVLPRGSANSCLPSPTPWRSPYLEGPLQRPWPPFPGTGELLVTLPCREIHIQRPLPRAPYKRTEERDQDQAGSRRQNGRKGTRRREAAEHPRGGTQPEPAPPRQVRARGARSQPGPCRERGVLPPAARVL